MNIVYIGSGFVGACSAAVSAASGHQTLVYDIDKEKIQLLGSSDRNSIESCIFEEGLADLLIRNSGKLHFTHEYQAVENILDTCDVVFICVPTPEVDGTGESDLSYYRDATEKLAMALGKRNNGAQEKYVVVVNKSTVPVDMTEITHDILAQKKVKNVGVVSNPEFLVEGKAVDGALNPDRVVIGADKEKDFFVMREVYQRFFDSPNIRYIEVNPREAAAGKLLANFYLFGKLMFCFDVIGRVSETFENIRFEQVRDIITADPRISGWGFYDSLYAGGSCFIKDARSLAHQLQIKGADSSLINQVYLSNRKQLDLFLGRAEMDAKFQWTGAQVAILGLAFKQDTNDIRNSPSIDIVHFLREKGVDKITVYDPAAKEYFARHFPPSDTMIYASDESEAVSGADCIIIATDWPQFKNLHDIVMEAIVNIQKKPLIMDGRRMLQHRYTDLAEAGCDIIAVGSPFIQGNKS